MHCSPSLKANSRTARQENTNLSWKLKGSHVHKSPPLIYILSNMNRDHPYFNHNLRQNFVFFISPKYARIITHILLLN